MIKNFGTNKKAGREIELGLSSIAQEGKLHFSELIEERQNSVEVLF